MTRLLIGTSVIFVICSFLLVGVRAANSANKSPTLTVLELYQCSPEPCWHDIRPGVTPVEQAWALLATDHGLSMGLGSYDEHCWFRLADPLWRVCLGPLKGVPGDLVGYIYVQFGQGTESTAADAPRLGDVLTLYGAPWASKLCWYRFMTGSGAPGAQIAADVYFNDGLYAAASDPRDSYHFRFDPNMPLFLISYSLPISERLDIPRWRGFTKATGQGC